MTLIELTSGAPASGASNDGVPAVGDRPHCPECGVEPALQTVVYSEQDGALHLVVMTCGRCEVDHPAWY